MASIKLRKEKKKLINYSMTEEEQVKKLEEKVNILKSVVNSVGNSYFSKDWVLENIFKSKSSIRKFKIKKILNNE
jgi:hypothetical protein